MTIAGITAGMGTMIAGVPTATLAAYAYVIKDGPPKWFIPLIFPMILIGVFLFGAGNVLLGIFGRGQDDAPTQPQVNAATLNAIAVNQQAKAADPKADPQLGGK